MTDDWRDYDTHLMQQGTTANVRFHATPECRKIKYPEKTVDRSESFLAYHEPEPCEVCHDDVKETARANCDPKKYVRAALGGGD